MYQLTHEQALLVLLLIEVAQLPEPELTLAWELHALLSLTRGSIE